MRRSPIINTTAFFAFASLAKESIKSSVAPTLLAVVSLEGSIMLPTVGSFSHKYSIYWTFVYRFFSLFGTSGVLESELIKISISGAECFLRTAVRR